MVKTLQALAIVDFIIVLSAYGASDTFVTLQTLIYFLANLVEAEIWTLNKRVRARNIFGPGQHDLSITRFRKELISPLAMEYFGIAIYTVVCKVLG